MDGRIFLSLEFYEYDTDIFNFDVLNYKQMINQLISRNQGAVHEYKKCKI